MWIPYSHHIHFIHIVLLSLISNILFIFNNLRFNECTKTIHLFFSYYFKPWFLFYYNYPIYQYLFFFVALNWHTGIKIRVVWMCNSQYWYECCLQLEKKSILPTNGGFSHILEITFSDWLPKQISYRYIRLII